MFLLAHAVTARINSAGVISVREGDDLLVSLEDESNRPFSPLVAFQWIYNGAKLNSSQRILLTGYNISITGVQRKDAGEYQLIVTNSAGSGVGNFTLDVLCKLVCYHYIVKFDVFHVPQLRNLSPKLFTP